MKQNKTSQRERDVKRLNKMQKIETSKKVEIAQLEAQMEAIHDEISELKRKLR